MRAIEFLLEYDRAKTMLNLGNVLHQKMVRDRTVQRIFGDDPVEIIDPAVLIEFGLDRFQEADPSPNKQYVQWIARTYAKDPNFKFEDVLSTVHPYLDKFYKLIRRKKIPSPQNDINKYTDFKVFMGVLDQFPDPDQEAVQKDKGSAFTLYEDDQWRVIVPQDQAAGCYYGQGTRWCTAATKAKNMFDYYNEIAPLLIAIPKDPMKPGEKYQLYFGVSVDDNPVKSDSDLDDIVDEYTRSGYDDEHVHLDYGQIMDEYDDPMSLFNMQRRMKDSWDGMINAYMQKFPDRKWQLYYNLDHAEGNDYM